MDRQLDHLKVALDRVKQDAAAWRDVCDAISSCFGAVGTIIMSLEPEFRGVWLFQSKVLEPVTEAYIAEGWQFKDVRQKLVPKGVREGFVSDDDLGDRRSLMKLPYFRDFLMKQGLGFGAVIVIKLGEEHFALSMQFPADRPAFIESEKKLSLQVRDMVMETAARISEHANAKFEDLVSLMSQSVDELTVFDVLGRATFSSKSGLKNLAHTDWPMDEIESACKADPAQYRPRHIQLERSGVDRRFNILQLPSSLRHFFTENKVIVLVTEGEASGKDRARRLGALYSLTESEMTCTELLAGGRSPDEIAIELGLKVSTIRQRLKDILQKTGVSSQAKLVSLYFLQ